MRRLGLRLALSLLTLALLAPCTLAQRSQATLSEGEIEQLRDSAYIANDRVMLFIKLIDVRIKFLEDLYAKPRRPGREQDTHDLMEQFSSLSNELSDNLDDYGPRHRDIRKALPKLIEATERWATVIKTPPDDSAYNVSRRIALESLQDLRDQSNELIPEQKAWFIAHPPAKKQSPAETDNAPR
ncbi:MAG TPA: hypothetical protein VK608_16965 [Edaphobacter sp.]|nr:hypothetical protein [Edaphobacter sp.]